MRNRHLLILFIAIVLCYAPLSAQVRVRPQGNQNGQSGGAVVHHNPVGLTVSSNGAYAFWVYLDDVLQNEESVHSIAITDIPQADVYVRVEFDDMDHHCFGQYVEFDNTAKAFVIGKRSDYYGWSVSNKNIRAELTMRCRVQQNSGIPPQAGGYQPGSQPGGYQPGGQPWEPQPGGQPGGYQPGGYQPGGQPGFGPCLPEREFAQVLASLDKESFDNTRLTVAKQIVAVNPMCAEQIVQICGKFSFESNKLEMAKYAYAFCTDKNRYYLLNSVFTYDSSKRELNEFINQ